ncbi:sulfite exporter TauE/SafE family protein [Parendozoicomonas haliclonae]|uniref:Probable membrane transporter protein n=1 Tax=Parendozoicomonas haliclonae TaxID=1960125 RepID=A0A1X7AIY9_9GAMM|nr:sulfite exporter TauE/SafE family protein [Parendozoicomonas haliclonae]SMA44849.1 Sulfite exporter TauE/SafE [Parendozoicomonas haliclonae]
MDYFWVSLAVMLGAAVQTAFGFGLAIVCAPLLIMLDPQLVPGPLIFCSMLQGSVTVYHNRHDLDLRGLVSALVGRIPGTAVGIWLLTFLNYEQLSIIVGVIVLLAVVVSVSKVNIAPTKVSMFCAGMVSGLFGSTTAVGGPPMALLMQNQASGHLRANMAGFFLFGSFISLLALSWTGKYGLPEIKQSFSLLPGVLLGYFLCRLLPLQRWDRFLRPGILVICTVCGSLAILKGVSW